MDFANTISVFEESHRIIKEDSQRGLERTRDEVIDKIRKLQVLLTILKRMDFREIDLPDKENLKKSIRILTFQDFLTLDQEVYLLNLSDCKTVGLSYTERKAVRTYLIDHIPKVCEPPTKFFAKMQEELLIATNDDGGRQEIAKLEEKRRQLQLKLAEVKNKKCNLQKKCADIKMGPYLKNELDVMLAEHKLNQIKANALQGYLVNELFSRTEHTVKAIKEVEGFIDVRLEEVEDE